MDFQVSTLARVITGDVTMAEVLNPTVISL